MNNTSKLGVIFLCLFEAVAAFAANPSDSPKIVIEPKTHVLFMGADISLERNRKFYPVAAVTSSSLVVKDGSKEIVVSLSDPASLRIDESLKLARTSVAIERLNFERSYANGSDPFDQLAQSAALAASNTALADIARGDVMRANAMVATAGAQGQTEGGGGSAGADMGRALAAQAQAEAAFSQALNAPIAEVYDVGSQSVKAGGEARYDAIRIRFDLTPETDLTDSYLGVVALIHDGSGKSGGANKWTYIHPLGRLSAHVTKKVLIYRGGFPPGYSLENCEVHLYAGGEEIATNLSRKRVLLTDDEAVQFRIIEYVGANKGRTLPAALLTASLAPEQQARLTPNQVNATSYVRVGRDGGVIAAFRDVAGKQPLQDPVLEAALKTLRFKPALNVGRPVESTVAVSLAQIDPVKEKE